MDWNWFFSATAQSFAAIVGLLGAFVFARLVASQGEYSRAAKQLESLLIEARAIKARADDRAWEWFNEETRELAVHRLARLMDRGDQEAIEEFIDEYEGSPFDEPFDFREEFKRRLAGSPAEAIADLARSLNPTSVAQAAEEEKLKQLTRGALQHVDRIEKALAIEEKNPHSSQLVSVTLGALLLLFFTGVIYPLSFLPLSAGVLPGLSFSAFWTTLLSFKGGLLTVLSAMLVTLVGVFFKANRELKHDSATLVALRQFADPKEYSVYIGRASDAGF